MKKLDITLIGDAHGKWDKLAEVAKTIKTPEAIIIGDVGLGFQGYNDPKLPEGINFFRGNHDNPTVCAAHPQCIGDYGLYKGMFYVAGADSIDKEHRTAGIDWWGDEQLDRKNMEFCLEEYNTALPDIVVTHEAPCALHPLLYEATILNYPASSWGYPQGNSTAFLLDALLANHAPSLWVFGHWHRSLSFRMGKTRFICLDELETLEI